MDGSGGALSVEGGRHVASGVVGLEELWFLGVDGDGLYRLCSLRLCGGQCIW